MVVSSVRVFVQENFHRPLLSANTLYLEMNKPIKKRKQGLLPLFVSYN